MAEINSPNQKTLLIPPYKSDTSNEHHWGACFSPYHFIFKRMDFRMLSISATIDGLTIIVDDASATTGVASTAESDELAIGDPIFVSDVYTTIGELFYKGGICIVTALTSDPTANTLEIVVQGGYKLPDVTGTIDYGSQFDFEWYINFCTRDFKLRTQFRKMVKEDDPNLAVLELAFLDSSYYEFISPPDGMIMVDVGKLLRLDMKADIIVDWAADTIVRERDAVANCHPRNYSCSWHAQTVSGTDTVSGLIMSPELDGTGAAFYQIGAWANHSVLQRKEKYTSEVVDSWEANNLYRYELAGQETSGLSKFLTPFENVPYYPGYPLTLSILTYWFRFVDNVILPKLTDTINFRLKVYKKDGTISDLTEEAWPFVDSDTETIKSMAQFRFVINNIFDIPDDVDYMEFWLESINGEDTEQLTEKKRIVAKEVCEGDIYLIWRNNLGGDSFWMFNFAQEQSSDVGERFLKLLKCQTYGITPNDYDGLNELNSSAKYTYDFAKTRDILGPDAQLYQKVYVYDGTEMVEVVNVQTKSKIMTNKTRVNFEVNIQLPENFTKI